jgi:hypothetical protein
VVALWWCAIISSAVSIAQDLVGLVEVPQPQPPPLAPPPKHKTPHSCAHPTLSITCSRIDQMYHFICLEASLILPRKISILVFAPDVNPPEVVDRYTSDIDSTCSPCRFRLARTLLVNSLTPVSVTRVILTVRVSPRQVHRERRNEMVSFV